MEDIEDHLVGGVYLKLGFCFVFCVLFAVVGSFGAGSGSRGRKRPSRGGARYIRTDKTECKAKTPDPKPWTLYPKPRTLQKNYSSIEQKSFKIIKTLQFKTVTSQHWIRLTLENRVTRMP